MNTICGKGPVNFEDSDFRSASFCIPAEKLCVLVAVKGGQVAVRDSKDPTKNTLVFSEAEWNTFVRGIKSGQFD